MTRTGDPGLAPDPASRHLDVMSKDRFRVAVITADDELWQSTHRRLEEHGLVADRLAAALGVEGRKLAKRADAVLVDERRVDVAAAIDAWLRAGWIERNCPVLVVSPDPPEREKHLAWLRGGAWGVLRTPVDGEVLAVQLDRLVRSARSDADGNRAQTASPYNWSAFVRATDETLSLARRYHRPLSCLAVSLDWPDRGDGSARDVVARLARPAQLAARRYDLVGLGRTGVLLILLPDTAVDHARTFRDRLVPLLEDHLRSWGVLARLRSAVVGPADTDTPAADLLELAARSVT